VAAFAPLIASAIPLLTPLVTGLVHHVEALFGTKTGPAKFSIVLACVTAVATQLSTAGMLPGQLDPASIAAMIESVVQELKSKGILNPPSCASIIAGQSAALPQSLTLNGTFTLKS
jgi:hypothetical protein